VLEKRHEFSSFDDWVLKSAMALTLQNKHIAMVFALEISRRSKRFEIIVVAFNT